MAVKGIIRTAKQIGFRPLAGFWFLNTPLEAMKEMLKLMFPSPCGVLVLKLRKRNWPVSSMNCFRPLAGFWFLNILQSILYIRVTTCFRPLAGFWFLNRKQAQRKRRESRVSVPLRGSGS